VAAIDLHRLTAEAAPLANRGDAAADGAHQRDGDVVGFHDLGAGRLVDMNRVHRLRWESQPLRDRGDDLFLSSGVYIARLRGKRDAGSRKSASGSDAPLANSFTIPHIGLGNVDALRVPLLNTVAIGGSNAGCTRAPPFVAVVF
jgi:hypothetical protein